MNLINTIESMKKVFLFAALALLCLACNEAGKSVSVTVSNATSLERDAILRVSIFSPPLAAA